MLDSERTARFILENPTEGEAKELKRMLDNLETSRKTKQKRIKALLTPHIPNPHTREQLAQKILTLFFGS